MKNLKRKAITLSVIIALLSAIGCDEDDVIIKELDAGVFVKSEEITTSWNDSVRSKVTTSKGVFTVKGVISALNGEAATLRIYKSARRYLCLENAEKCKWIY